MPRVPQKVKEPSWIVKELFEIADSQKLTLIDLQQAFFNEGHERHKCTIRFWKSGHTQPSIKDTEVLAHILGYELDLLLSGIEGDCKALAVKKDRKTKALKRLPSTGIVDPSWAA